MELKDLLKKYRNEKCLTQKQLGELSGLSEATIRKYELGLRNPKIKNLQKIAGALEVSFRDLVGEKAIDINSNIIRARKLCGFTIEDLSEKTGIAVNRLAALETGNEYPTSQELLKISKETGEPPGSLIMPVSVTNWDFDALINIWENPISTKNQKQTMLLQYFDQLNENGKDQALESLGLLIKIPEYKKAP